MQISRTSFEETNQFSGLFLDYMKGKKKTEEFFTYKPSIESFKQIIEDRKKLPINRIVLSKVIKDQYKNFTKENNALVFQHIDSLINENTFTVCTGHQLCLFTGPLYFIYKLISVIRLSEELQKHYPESRFVPVYWMAAEDHDFEEINHIHLYGKKLEWNKYPEWQDLPVGNLPASSIKILIDELKTILGENENAFKIIDTFRNAYLENINLASATRYLVNELLGKYGLVVVDGDDKALKQFLKPILLDDIFSHNNFRLVNESVAKLESKNYKAPVNPREINFFYYSDNKRKRIEQKENQFHVLNTDKVFSADEIKLEIENQPERFSPNVVTRPLYQQLILPNLAYVGGPNELAYWLEFKSMFAHQQVLFPALVPRNFVLLVNAATSDKASKFNLRIPEFFEETESLIKKFISRLSGEEMNLTTEEKELRNLYGNIIRKIKNTDPTLQATVEAELQKQIHFISNLTSRLIRSEKQKQETSVNQIRKIKEKLFPGGELQERYDNFLPYYLQHGESFFDMLKDSFQAIPDALIVAEV